MSEINMSVPLSLAIETAQDLMCERDDIIKMATARESVLNDQIAQLTKEREELRGKLDALKTIHDDALKSRKQMLARAETAEAKCAEMREAILWLDGYFTANIDGGGRHSCPWCYQSIEGNGARWTAIVHSDKCLIGHALSDQCDVGWISPEKKKVLVEALENAYRAACHFMVCRECAESELCHDGQRHTEKLAACDPIIAGARN